MRRLLALVLLLGGEASANYWYFACSSSACTQELTTTAPSVTPAYETSACVTSTTLVQQFSAKTPPLKAVTVSGAITCAGWGNESNIQCNNGFACTIYYQSTCSTDTSTTMTGAASSEWGTTPAQRTSSGTVSSTSAVVDSCFRVSVGKIQSGGTGGTSRNVSLAYTGGSGVTCPGTGCTTTYVLFNELLEPNVTGPQNTGMMGFWGWVHPTLWRLMWAEEPTLEEALDGRGHWVLLPMEG